MNPEILTADPTGDLTARVPHLQPDRKRCIRSSQLVSTVFAFSLMTSASDSAATTVGV